MQKSRQKMTGNVVSREADVAKAPSISPKGEEMEKIEAKKILSKIISIKSITCQIRVPSPLERGWGEARKLKP